MSKLPGPWSFSSIKKFDNCPRAYYEIRIAKNFKEPESTDATMYGKDFHTAAEEYVRDGTPLPERFTYAKQQLDALLSIPGTKHCEYKMALTESLEPCDFFDKAAWFRGVADLLIVNEETGKARVVDYKTGKSAKYADTGQLELMALCLWKHFPKIRSVKGGLLFVVCNEFKKDAYYIDKEHTYWRNWMPLVTRLETAHHTNVWNPKKSGLCKAHCIVTTCSHNGKRNE